MMATSGSAAQVLAQTDTHGAPRKGPAAAEDAAETVTAASSDPVRLSKPLRNAPL
jgi:hypothetical protein